MSKYRIKRTSTFKKDLKRLLRQGIEADILVLTLTRSGSHSDLKL
ncbi:MAG: type II toxin-antitoxin system YafQ family toxin [Clostridiales Family XIII bacterium]|nr:type II toxin-antitoxin system YafQ family toxin [Clostridiales Family XIII bacterium]